MISERGLISQDFLSNSKSPLRYFKMVLSMTYTHRSVYMPVTPSTFTFRHERITRYTLDVAIEPVDVMLLRMMYV